MPVPDNVDIVLEGGGVKGLAFAGALAALGNAGTTPQRVAGVSAGALAAAVAAALSAAGESLTRAEDVIATLDVSRVTDSGPFGVLSRAVGLLRYDGLYRGRYVADWLRGVLGDLGVSTFADLALPPDPDTDLPVGNRYRLLVLATDVSRQRLARLPWDYPLYGRDPDEMPVVDAVRASAAIPYFFRPSRLQAADGIATLLDGALLANYPIGVFDRTDGRPPRWPTVGVALTLGPGRPTRPVRGLRDLAAATVATLLEAGGATHLTERCTAVRSVVVDTGQISALDFELSPDQRRALVEAGRSATAQFLDQFDFPSYVDQCRGGAV